MTSKIATSSQHRIFYSKLGGDRYRFLCSECGANWEGTRKDLMEYKHYHTCPHCFQPVQTRDNDKYPIDNAYVIYYERDFGTDLSQGYLVEYSVRYAIINETCPLLVYQEIDNRRCRYRIIHPYYVLNKGYYYKVSYDDAEWKNKKYSSYSRIYECFISGSIAKRYTKKEFIAEVLDDWSEKPLVKSNQIKLFKDNPINRNIIQSIIAFNIVDFKDVKKNIAFINDLGYKSFELAYKHKMNVYDLYYLSSEKVHVNDYLDYLNNAKKIGWKDKRPKNFREADSKLNEIIQKQREVKLIKENNSKIKAFVDKLPSTTFKAKEGKYIIEPFKNAEEVRDVANEFHNCMFNLYLEKYASEECLLYKCYIKDKNYACIEIKNGKVVQVRGKHNESVSNENKIRKALEKMIKEEEDVKPSFAFR